MTRILGIDPGSQRTGIGLIEVLAAPESFEAVKAAMAAAGHVPLQAEVTMRADNDIKVAGETALQVKKMLDMLEDLDDVQDVYSNAELDEAAYR